MVGSIGDMARSLTDCRMLGRQLAANDRGYPYIAMAYQGLGARSVDAIQSVIWPVLL